MFMAMAKEVMGKTLGVAMAMAKVVMGKTLGVAMAMANVVIMVAALVMAMALTLIQIIARTAKYKIQFTSGNL